MVGTAAPGGATVRAAVPRIPGCHGQQGGCRGALLLVVKHLDDLPQRSVFVHQTVLPLLQRFHLGKIVY